MAKFCCKVCGQQIDQIDGAVIATCTSCGSRQVLPISLSDEYLKCYFELIVLQQSGQFEEAEELFEHLILEGGVDAALHWLGVLIDYRAVYKADIDGKYTIVCGKADEISVLENDGFQKVLNYASPAQRGIFEKDGSILESSRLELLGKHDVVSKAERPLNRGFLCLEDGAWDAAMAQFDRVLADEPENSLAYFGKMMAELQVRRESELSHTGMRILETENYNNVLKYGNELLCDRLRKYRDSGILYQAVEHIKCAETIDDWKHVKKLLMEVCENERAREYLALCDRKIRAIMVREAQLVMGCREAVNLGITTDTLGTRMVSANYYYDFDMSDKISNKGQKKFKPISSRVVAIFALITLLVLTVVIIFSFFINSNDKQDQDNNLEANISVSDNTKTIDTLEIEKAPDDIDYGSEQNKEFCVAGNMAFTLNGNGKVVNLSQMSDAVSNTEETKNNGASFTLNLSPYESDYFTWSDVAHLYSTPNGEMLLGVMENGTVSYDIFSSSNMNYETVYKPVSSWMNVKELIWESGNLQNPILFAITDDGNIYASNTEVENNIVQVTDVFRSQGFSIEAISAENGIIHILMTNGSYFSINYNKQ